jgi:hypothetical protein
VVDPPIAMRAAAVLAFIAACSRSGEVPRLDPRQLPPELFGVVPGEATERAVGDALPDAVATRDARFGGRHDVRLSGEPAIRVESEERGVEAWLIRLRGQPRVTSLFARVDRPCAEVIADFGGRLRSGACTSRPDPPQARERRYCARTADGAYAIDVACFEPRRDRRPGHLSLWVDVIPAKAREYHVAPARLQQ